MAPKGVRSSAAGGVVGAGQHAETLKRTNQISVKRLAAAIHNVRTALADWRLPFTSKGRR